MGKPTCETNPQFSRVVIFQLSRKDVEEFGASLRMLPLENRQLVGREIVKMP